MGENILNQIQKGSVSKYNDLKKQWEAVKGNPQDPSYGFLGSIFGMDSAKKNYSESIFNTIANRDNQEGLSKYDLDRLARQSNYVGGFEN